MFGSQRSSGHDPFAALRIRYVAPFALGRVAASLGAQMVSVAVGWELYERTGDPWALGLVGLVELAPAVVLMLPSGNAADRFPRRNIAMVAYALAALAASLLAIISWLEAPVEYVYMPLVLMGAVRAIASPSVGTILPQLLKPRDLANANAWLISSGQLSSISGPAIGGILIAITGEATSSYVLAAIGQVIFLAVLTRLPAIPPERITTKRSARDLFAGLHFVRSTPILLAAITLDLFAVLLGGAVALLPIFAKDILQIGPEGLGMLRAAPSLGALMAALVATRIPPWQRPGRVLLFTVAGFGVATIGFGLSRDVWLSLICLFFTGVFDSISMVIRQTLHQVITPDALRGRVAAVNYLFISFSNELGAFESGALASLFTPVISVVGGGIGTLVVVGIAMVVWPALARIGPLHTLAPAEIPPDLEPQPARRSAVASGE